MSNWGRGASMDPFVALHDRWMIERDRYADRLLLADEKVNGARRSTKPATLALVATADSLRGAARPIDGTPLDGSEIAAYEAAALAAYNARIAE